MKCLIKKTVLCVSCLFFTLSPVAAGVSTPYQIVAQAHQGEGSLSRSHHSHHSNTVSREQRVSNTTENSENTGWQKKDEHWYYCDEDGHMLTGICEVNGSYYCFDSEGKWDGHCYDSYKACSDRHDSGHCGY